VSKPKTGRTVGEVGWIDSDIVIVDKGRRERRRDARGGLRGRRGARRVAPCPMFCVTSRYQLSEGERRELIETFEKYSRMGAPRFEVVPATWVCAICACPATDGDNACPECGVA
jgi:hypothetical protein